ncbi:glycolate oxidase [Pedobacter steynii]|uniref:Glycolate oxidase n=1 Tax=Pedobacter steynii TaxID=430522 RepID=A0A1G9V9Q4_9SPHI|nr:FAD-binding oxidoreductase [Pedobacter steynii]NQX41022.1 FAD-binding oxidoreductase [Pedobacter steynii]SDM68797.1 glycolate oxidase [Pedobacter steynii]
MKMIQKEKIDLAHIVSLFKEISGDQYVLTDPDDLYHYERDQTLNLNFNFDILIKPASAQEISNIVQLCNQYSLPITPRGGGTGVTGGALPLEAGVVLSLERLNKIIEINKTDSYVLAESGVITADLCESVEEHGLYFPIRPTSSFSSFIGGNVAENSGSINSCKYGTTSRYVLNLEVVLPSGEIIWTGANVSKNVTGLNLTQLFVGSEGILGIVTKIVYQLLPKPKSEVMLLAGFKSLEDACHAILEIKGSSVFPSGVELISLNAIQLTTAYMEKKLPLTDPDIQAQLLISLQELSDAEMEHSLLTTSAILEKYTERDVLVAETLPEKKAIAELRVNIGNALTADHKYYRDIDACVPVSALCDYVWGVEQICMESNIEVISFGHAIDGNLHTNLVFDKKSGLVDPLILNEVLTRIYRFAISKGGVISGEHGIGFLQKEFLPLQLSNSELNLMISIKNLIDPNGIMNPGKIF